MSRPADAIACTRCGAMFKRLPGSHTRLCSTACRFLAKVVIDPNSGCWLWTGSQDGHGYGQLSISGRPTKAHRWAYEHLGNGDSLVADLVLDHLCRNRACVNPEHLEQVTNRENCLRGEAPGVQTWRSGVCQRGHSMADAIVKPSGARTCRPCENARQRAYYRAAL